MMSKLFFLNNLKKIQNNNFGIKSPFFYFYKKEEKSIFFILEHSFFTKNSQSNTALIQLFIKQIYYQRILYNFLNSLNKKAHVSKIKIFKKFWSFARKQNLLNQLKIAREARKFRYKLALKTYLLLPPKLKKEQKQLPPKQQNKKSKNFIKFIKKRKERVSTFKFFFSLIKSLTRVGNHRKPLNKIIRAFISFKKSKKLKKLRMFNLFHNVRKKIKPLFYIRRFNLGRKTFLIPSPILHKKKEKIAAKWYKRALQSKKESDFTKNFITETKNLLRNTGMTMRIRAENIRIARENRGNVNRKFRKKKRRG